MPRPEPLPGQERRECATTGPARYPRAARRPGRRARILLSGLCAGTALLVCGIGPGAVGTTLAGANRPAEPQRRAAPWPPASKAGPPVRCRRCGSNCGVPRSRSCWSG
ncbi:hypothetical protein QQY24_06835 [Streptomyces sp. TG1A-8]|uniref:hypothetical protein n=1 Tax=Streptomyces sp. TG1A-8 TaxID=3051385 RepID=UPI00265BA72D|nr:hypothetical protein [Streptomyces sp. TG1A-8]MDO0925151.1 hypothetical protein [Streptomyces sp. TG1A-8]